MFSLSHVIAALGSERFAIPANLVQSIESPLDLRREGSALFFLDAPIFDPLGGSGFFEQAPRAALLLKSGFGILCSDVQSSRNLSVEIPLDPFFCADILFGAGRDEIGPLWTLDSDALAQWPDAISRDGALPLSIPRAALSPFPSRSSVAILPPLRVGPDLLDFWLISIAGISESRWALSPREIDHLLPEVQSIPVPGAFGSIRHGAWIGERFVPVWLGEFSPQARVHALVAARDPSGARREILLPLSDIPDMLSVAEVDPIAASILPPDWRSLARSGFWMGKKPVLAFAPEALLQPPSP